MPVARHTDRPATWRALLRGAARRCPRCGAGHLFRRWVHMVESCPGCRYRFNREDGFFLGALVINVIVVEGALIALLAVGFATTRPHTPVGLLAAIGAVGSVIVPVLGYPFSKTLWCAVDQTMRAGMGESFGGDGSQPGFATHAVNRGAGRRVDGKLVQPEARDEHR